MSARRYLNLFVASFLSLAAFTATLNLSVDPYLVFGSARIDGFNQVKTEINDYVRTAKVFEPFRRPTNVLLVGNSRIEMGLDPNHACFDQLEIKAYNLGLPGAGVGQQLNYALNVIYAQPVQRVLLSVDFVDFIVAEGAMKQTHHAVVATDNLPHRFDGSRNPDYTWATTQTYFQALLSLNSLSSSIQTIVQQGAYQPDRLANGFNPANDIAQATSLEGPGALFEQKMASLRQRFASPKSIYYDDGTLTNDFDFFSRFLSIAAANGIEVVVMTNPFHEQFWNLLRKRGLMEMHADWLAEIERRVRDAPGGVTMWDFTADSEFIHELVPAQGMKTPPLDWFWEPSHYRKTLGDKMLDSMFAMSCGSHVSFGRQLNTGY